MNINETTLAEMNKYEVEGLSLKEKATTLVIDWPDTLLEASNLLKECNSLSKEVDKERKRLTDPLTKRVKTAIAKAKELAFPAEEAKSLVKQKILDYNKKIEAIKKKEQERLAQEKKEREAKESRLDHIEPRKDCVEYDEEQTQEVTQALERKHLG